MLLVAAVVALTFVLFGCLAVMAAVVAARVRKGPIAWLLSTACVAFVIASIVPLMWAAGLVVSRPLNDLRLRHFASQIFDVPLPDGAQEVERSSRVGAFLGCGNGCDFIARRVVRTTGDVELLRARFGDLDVAPASGSGAETGAPTLTVERHGDALVVTIVDGRYEGGLDWRCH